MTKAVGIWLDSREANVISINNEKVTIETVVSEIEDFHPVGGSRSNVPYGPVETVSEQHFLERKKHQENNYFDKIIDLIISEKEIVIFGPAQTKDRLLKRIGAKASIRNIVRDCIKADSMTQNQKVAFIKKYFRENPKLI